jgi:hypothetical protein
MMVWSGGKTGSAVLSDYGVTTALHSGRIHPVDSANSEVPLKVFGSESLMLMSDKESETRAEAYLWRVRKIQCWIN